MALDPRISLGVAAPSLQSSLELFQNTLTQQQNREAQRQQMQRAQALAPFQQQILEQRAAAGQAAQSEQEENRILRSVAEFGQRLKPVLQSGNNEQALTMLTERFKDLQAQGLPTNETVDAITAIRSGDTQGVIGAIDAAQSIAQQRGLTGTTPARAQFGAQQTFKDSAGNLFFGTTKRDPTTGQVKSVLASVSGDESRPVGQVSLVSGLGQTAEEKQQTEIETTTKVEEVKATAKGKSEAVKAGVGQAVKAFEKIPLVRTAINNYDEAIAALDAGAETGTIDSMLPSLRKASKELDNVIKRLGLDVVGNTTFGALSESELKFALKAAIPDNLQPAELKQWLLAKKNAQQKILTGLDEMATFLGGGTKTIADWNNQQALNKLAGDSATQKQQQTVVPASIARPTVQVGRFTVEEVND